MPIRRSPNDARHPRPQGGRDHPEQVVAINRNDWSQSIGTPGRDHPVRAHGVHSADVVLNILARQRDPGPPATILTPAALTLRHAPVADCARYDNLRRTV